MQELTAARILVDRALERLDESPPDHPLRRVETMKLRRLLAEAAFRELRQLEREIREAQPDER